MRKRKRERRGEMGGRERERERVRERERERERERAKNRSKYRSEAPCKRKLERDITVDNSLLKPVISGAVFIVSPWLSQVIMKSIPKENIIVQTQLEKQNF